ncbi:MAG: 23S rRNA (adenine(2030)-N(6))-methyltransferase RlmJ [Rubrivivax sp.]
MLAYRHAFHAGNHGDVLKHIALMQVLRHMNLKDKGWRFVDTHAGAGGYSLHSTYAKKNGEYTQGVGRLWGRTDVPAPVADYLDLIRQFNGGSTLKQYPGSPAIANALCREQDQLRLFEMHPTDYRVLASYLAEEPGVEVKMSDGFEGLKSRLPPPTRRGVVLMDPSYELDRDYSRVVTALRDGMQRFADGTFMVWYPLVGKLPAVQLPKRLKALAPKRWVHARLTVQPFDARGFGMAGSGVFIINPPHTLHAELNTLLPWLHEVLKQFDGGGWVLEQKAD